MTSLAQINAYTESTIAQLYNNTDTKDIRTHFSLIVRRSEELLHEIKLAEELEHLLFSDMLGEHAFSIVQEAVKVILTTTDNLVHDLHFVNQSGIHNIESNSHLSYILASIFERAEALQRGSGIKAWFKAKFHRSSTFANRFEAAIVEENASTMAPTSKREPEVVETQITDTTQSAA